MKPAYRVLAALLLLGSAHAALNASAMAADDIIPMPADKNPEVLIRADHMNYDGRTNTVSADGHVEVVYGERMLIADKITYNQQTRVVVAEGRVSIREPDGTTIYGNKIEITDDMKDGLIESLNVVLAGRGNLAAARGTRTGGNVMTLEKAVYSTCEPCKEDPTRPPTWQIKAFRIVYNREKARVEYEDAFFEIAGIPVAYLPYFSHSDPSSPRESGFLVPGIGHSTDIGYFVEVPYYFALSPSYDLTVAPVYTENDGPLLKGEWRERTRDGAYSFSGSVRYGETYDENGNGTGEDSFGSHLFGHGRFQIDDVWRWGFDAQLTSNDTYLKRYDITSLDRLVNNVFIEGVDGRSYAAVNAWYFQGLRETDDPGTTPIVLPLAEIEYVPDEPVLGGRFSLAGNLLVLQRGDGVDTNRISAIASWKLSVTTTGGHLFTLFANLRGDIYHITDTGPSGDDQDTVARILPWAGAEWRFPLVSTDWGMRTVIEPIVQAIAAPYGGNPDEIPNEDSDSFEFDETNLFSYNKFPGVDRWETGPRINAGIRAATYFDDGFAEAIVGESYRLHEDDAFTEQSGLRNQQSDYVGRLTLQPTSNFRIVQRFRVDQDAFRFERNELYAEAFDTNWYAVRAGYLQLEADPLIPEDREEVNVEGKLKAAEYWWLSASGRRDLADDQMIESKVGIAYEDECAVFGIDFRRRFTRDRDIEPASSFLFTFRLKGVN